MSKILRDIAFVTFLLFIIGTIIAANLGQLGSTFAFAQKIPYFDKFGHFVLMGGLAFLAMIAFVPRMEGTQRKSTTKVIIILLTVIALEEASQHFIPSRTFSVADFLFGVIGVLIAGAVSKHLPLKKENR